jgi:hypothetical protein
VEDAPREPGDGMSLICLAAAGSTVKLAAAVTLVWTHSVQKTRWEEDWQATPAGLVITEARVEGSGAGMDPPDDAILRDGTWHWTPKLGPQRSVALRRSGATEDWSVCYSGSCRPMGELVPANADPVTLTACE